VRKDRLVEREVIEAVGKRLGEMIPIERKPMGAKGWAGLVPMEGGDEEKLNPIVGTREIGLDSRSDHLKTCNCSMHKATFCSSFDRQGLRWCRQASNNPA
jgi:hypothetical protein